LLSLNDVINLFCCDAAVAIEKCKSLLDISKFLGNPNFDLVMKCIIRKPKEYGFH